MPKGLKIASETIQDFQTNRFRVEATSTDVATPGSTVSFALPSDCILDTRSCAFFFTVTTDTKVVVGKTVAGRIPADATSLISRMEVKINGQVVQQGCSEFNTVARMLKIMNTSRDKDTSIDRALHHGAIVSDNAAETATLCMSGSDFKGFLGSCGTRYLDLAAIGQIVITLTIAGPEVLAFKQTGVSVGTNFDHADARTAASQCSFSISNMYMTVATIAVSPMYTDMLRTRLQSENLRINYHHYDTFQDFNLSNSSTTKFSLSSQSINKVLVTYRDMNYNQRGIKSHTMSTTLADTLVANYFRFMSYDSLSDRVGTARFELTCNGIKHPQYQANTMDTLLQLTHAADKVHESSAGSLITSMTQYNQGMFIFATALDMPDQPVNVISGENSRGINSAYSAHVHSQLIPAAVPEDQNTGSISSFVCVQSTHTLVVGLGKSIVVDA